MKTPPVYVKLAEYNELLEIVKVLVKKVAQAEATLQKVESLREREAEELAAWRKNLDEVKKRIESISSTLVESE